MTEFKRLGLLSFLLMFVFSIGLAGCSSSKDTAGGEGSTTITVWHPMTGVTETAIKKVTKAFEEKYPDINVKLVYTAGGTEANKKLLAAIAGGNPPDVAYFDRFKVGQYAAQGALTDLTSFAEKDGVTKDDYYPFAWAEANYEGKLYGIPTSTDARMLFYNIDEFKKAGLDPNNPPKTIDELEQAAKQLTIKEGSRFKQIGFIPWFGQGQLYTWGWAFGGDFYNEETGKVTANDPKIVDALKWESEYAKSYGISNLTSFTNSQGTGARAPFISGNLSMIVSGNFTVAQIENYKPDLNYGVTPIPTPTGGDFQTWSGGWSVVIPKGAQHEEAAWKYLKFFGGTEGDKIYSKISGDLAAIPSVNKKLYSDDPIMKKFVDALENAHHRPVISQGQLLWNQLVDAVDKATHGNGSPKGILDQVTKKVNSALEK